MTLRLAVHGATGRMGRAVVAAALEEPDVEIVRLLEAPEAVAVGTRLAAHDVVASNDPTALGGASAVIDFSTPTAVEALVALAASLKVPVVIGTTGLDARVLAAVDRAAVATPVVLAPNMSAAVAVLLHLAERAASLLGPAYDAEIVEVHHRGKVDAPSGTALRLAEVVARARGLAPGAAIVTDRTARRASRGPTEIGVASLRAGDVIGEHTLTLAGEHERIELTHRAHGREVFARGALRAARWVVGRPPGRYDLGDVLGLRPGDASSV